VQVAIDHAHGHKILKHAMYNRLEEMRELVIQDPRAILAKEVAPLSLCAANATPGVAHGVLEALHSVPPHPVWRSTTPGVVEALHSVPTISNMIYGSSVCLFLT
jgi:hypothetical protein